MSILKIAGWTVGLSIVAVMIGEVGYLASTTKEEREKNARVAQAKHDAKTEADNRRQAVRIAARSCGDAYKRSMKNPASFELVDYSSDGKNIHIVFRGTNSFNAVVTDTGSCKL